MPTTTTTKFYNLGTDTCITQAGKVVRFGRTSLKDSTGAYNKIAEGTVVDKAFWDALVQNIDVTKRVHVSPLIKEFASEAPEKKYKEYPDGTKYELADGPRTITGTFPEVPFRFIKYLQSSACSSDGMWLLTDKGNYIGYDRDGSGDSFPIPFKVLVGMGYFETSDDIQNVKFSLDIPNEVQDANLFPTSATADLVNTNGLVQIEMKASAPSSTGYTISPNVYGLDYTALLSTDISGYDETADAVIAVTSITRTGGNYVVVFASPTSTNVVRIQETAVLTAKGFSFNTVTETIA
mgnify:CR=1 FL=1|tara:strand:- start:1611 stop:2492 length:882 start_codon:yes stop_codon:yes gene_type:complete